MPKNLDDYRNRLNLVQTNEPEIDKPVFRCRGFNGTVSSLGEIDEKLSRILHTKREEAGLSRAELGEMLGLSVAVYGRYERAFSRLTVSRMVHLCELLGIMPIDMLYEAAPHLWGKTPEEAVARKRLDTLLNGLPLETIEDLARVVRRFPTNTGNETPE